MTAPRQVLPGTTYLVTRRCAQRQLLLRPSKTTNEIFLYVLAVAAGRFGVLVHAYCVLSNHFHLILTDPLARLPAFEQYLDSLVARAVNASLGRWETFWAPSSYSAVALASPEDILRKSAYVLANPVAAGLVPRGSEWPGVWSAPEMIGGSPVTARRPSSFFRADGGMPESADLAITAPPGFESAAVFRGLLVEALGNLEARALAPRDGAPARFLGARKVLAQEPSSRPTPGEPHRNIKPRVAARDKWRRIESLSRLLGFLQRYRAALRARRSGDVGALFPPGTYLMRIAHGVPCAAA